MPQSLQVCERFSLLYPSSSLSMRFHFSIILLHSHGDWRHAEMLRCYIYSPCWVNAIITVQWHELWYKHLQMHALLWCNIFCKWFNPMLRLYNKCRWISMLKLLPDLTWKRWSIYYSSCSLLPRVEIVLYIIIIHVSEEADFFWACQVTPFEIHQSYPQYLCLHHLLQLGPGHSLHDRSIVCTTTATGPGTIRTQKTPSLRSPCLYIPFKVFVGRLWPPNSPASPAGSDTTTGAGH